MIKHAIQVPHIPEGQPICRRLAITFFSRHLKMEMVLCPQKWQTLFHLAQSHSQMRGICGGYKFKYIKCFHMHSIQQTIVILVHCIMYFQHDVF